MTQISKTDPRLKPATADEITDHLHQLFSTLPLRDGNDPVAVMKGYVIAVEGMPEWAIGRAVRSFLRGTVPHQDKKFCPRAPEFAVAVKEERDNVMIEAAKPSYGTGLHTYKPPKSKILEEPCSKDWARRLVEQGIHPRGSIWCPGEFGTEKHSMGTLFAPDPDWENAKPLVAPEN